MLIHRATGVINFAQGEMATFSTYIAWSLITNQGCVVLAGVRVTLAISFLGGAPSTQALIRPIERGAAIRS